MSAKRRLTQIFSELPQQERATLLSFAEFLQQQVGGRTVDEPLATPEPIERPSEESVVAAIKRLSRSFHMVDKGALLNETSALMSQHVMQGRAAADVIDELEVLFRKAYENLLAQRGAS
jgi:hypothetical protein